MSFLQNGICSFIGKTKCLDDPWNCICVCVYILCRCIYACRYLCLDLFHNIPLYLYHIYIFVKNVLCYICTSISISTVSQSLSIHPSTVSIYASINLSISMSMQMYIYIYIYNIHTYIHTCMRTYVHTYIRTTLLLNLHVSLLIRWFRKKNIAPVPFCTFYLFNSLDVWGELQEILTAMDDPFYMAAFRSKKLKRRNRRILQKLRAHKLIGTN